MSEFILNIVAFIPLDIRIVILGAIPVTELRAAIPIAIALGVPTGQAFFWSVVGNFLPVIPLLLLIPRLYELFSKITLFQSYLGKLIERTRKKGKQVEKYGALGLMLFVAIPLPGTGAWTGSLLAFILGINFWYSVMALIGGIVLAGIVVTLASLGFFQLARYFYDLEVLAVLALCGIVCWWIIKKWKSR
jgi:uncharacterized membrane protein